MHFPPGADARLACWADVLTRPTAGSHPAGLFGSGLRGLPPQAPRFLPQLSSDDVVNRAMWPTAHC